MAGIYIHIPFCKQRCFYCDFYKTTQVLKKPEFIEALLLELVQRKDWLKGEMVQTIYFGGGTPSLLSIDEINRIIATIYTNYQVNDTIEITLESNPDDLTEKQINNIKSTRVNRLSIGIQSFEDDQLKKMNRRHNAKQAIECVKNAQNAGFSNISTDLIYGLPNLTIDTWLSNLELMGTLHIQHLSAYHLTYEPGTKFDTLLKRGAIIPIEEEESVAQFKALINWAKQNNFEHYEISNFAKTGFYSKHNSSYWRQEKYLGVGPSAHSYNHNTRSWNVANLGKYLQGINTGQKYSESETLSDIDKYNEFLMTWLRTRWGVNLKKVEELFGLQQGIELKKTVQKFLNNGSVYMQNDTIILTDEGVLISDSILTELMR